MNKLQMLLTIGAASLLLVVVACFQAGEEEARITAPCIPPAGSNIDPCARQPDWSVTTAFSAGYQLENMPWMPYSITTRIRRISNRGAQGLWVPQFYVRGTFVPGSSRCVKDFAFIGVYDDGRLWVNRAQDEPGTIRKYNCFTEVEIHEYLNGSGPDRLPIMITHRFLNTEPEPDLSAVISDGPMSWLEGREMVFPLSRQNDITVGTWGHAGFNEFWDVQRREDGEVVVVGGWSYIDARFNYEFTLDRFSAEVKSAMDAVNKENGGRVGNDPNDKMMARDANLGTLLENLRTYGAYSVADITPVPPPTVPGETDPDPYGLMVSDIDLPASPEIPGGLEGTATTVPALGDEPTATATASTPESEEAGANPTDPPTSQSDIAPALTPTPRPSQQLNVIVPPCVPYPGSGVDPCSRRDTWEYHNPFRAVSFVIPDVFWTLRDLVIITDSPTSAPQFIVRAIVIPGSIRCGNAEFELKMISSYNDGWSESLQRGDSHCFVDIAVNEYLVGGGPNRLTVNTRVQPCRISGDEPACGADRWKVGVDSLRATGIEGVEWIFSLGGPRDLGALAWDIVGRWDVQLREDGEVVVVSRLKQTVLRSSSPENFDVNLSRVEQTLDDFRSIVKDAHRDLVEMTQGRITTRIDVRDQPAARMALDAGPTGLSDFIFSTTSIERLNATPTSPPPVPGENDPNPAGLTVNDIIATRVAGGVRIPGGLEDTATPVSALGDEPTATATAPTPESEESDE